MALSSFSIEAQGLDGRPYRIDVGSSPTTTVRGDRQFVAIEGGEQEDRGLDPIWPTELRAFARGIELDPSLLSGDDRSVPVKAFDTTGGIDTLVFSGYLVVDFFGDAPFEPLGMVEIRALDGLGTLKNDTILDVYTGFQIGSEDFLSYQQAITLSLQRVAPLDVEYAVQWYPDQGTITGSDNPLEYVGFDADNYRDERPDDRSFLSLLDTLRDLLKSMGATVRQVDRRASGADARWHVRQRDAIGSDGTIKTWVYSSAADSPSPTTLDRSRSLSVGDLKQDHSRNFIRRRQTVEVTHDHTPLGNFVSDPGFEDAGAGNPSPWTISDTEKLSAQVVSHDEPDNTPSASQDNTYLAQIKGVPAGGSNYPQDTPEFPISQTIETVTGAQPRTAGRIKQSFEGNNTEFSSVNNGILLRISIGGYFLGTRSATLTTDVRRGEGSLYCTEVARPILKGAVLPVVKTSTQQGENEFRGTLTLSERAEPGDTELLGSLSSDFNESREILYPSVETTEQVFRVQRFVKNPRAYPTFEIVFPFEDPSGTPLTGDIKYEVGGERLITRTEDTSTPNPDDYIYGGDAVYIDDIEFSLERGESKIDQTVVRATVPELGEAEAQTVRTSSGPTTQNLARVRGIDPNGTPFEPTQWGVGPLEDRTESDRTLAQLKAFQRLRYWQIHLEELTITEAARGGTLPLTGDELVTIDGTDYTVHSVRYDAAAGETRATLIEYNDFQG